MSTCRHAHCWVIGGGIYLWCPDCGAFRRMRAAKGQNGIEPTWPRWVYPRGHEKALKMLEKNEEQSA